MGTSSVTFTNSTEAKIYVAYMRLDWGCRNLCGEPWDVLGWIGLDPGETETRANSTRNRWYYYYAESMDGSVWAGPYVAEVRQARFDKCTCIGVLAGGTNPYHDVGFIP
jgi:hypothetical protein